MASTGIFYRPNCEAVLIAIILMDFVVIAMLKWGGQSMQFFPIEIPHEGNDSSPNGPVSAHAETGNDSAVQYLSTEENERFTRQVINMPWIGPTDTALPVDIGRFDKFFSRESIKNFNARYHNACNRRIRQGQMKTFKATLHGSWYLGFGKALQLYYLPLSWFFDDFAAKSACPIFANLTGNETIDEHEIDQNGSFSVGLNNFTGFLELNGSDQAILRFEGPGWLGFRDTMIKLTEQRGIKKIFTTKSALIRALWNPKPYVKKLLKILWTRLVDENDSYLAVHIRRGDKVESKEMKDIPVERYLSTVSGMVFWEEIAEAIHCLGIGIRGN